MSNAWISLDVHQGSSHSGFETTFGPETQECHANLHIFGFSLVLAHKKNATYFN